MTEKAKASFDELLAPTFRIVVEGRMPRCSLNVFGASGISELSGEKVVIRVTKGEIKIIGKSLKITLFEAKKVEISGDIISFEFVRSKRGAS